MYGKGLRPLFAANQPEQGVAIALVDAAVTDADGQRLLQGDGAVLIAADQIEGAQAAIELAPVVDLVVVAIIRFELGQLGRITVEQGQIIEPVAEGFVRFAIVISGERLPALLRGQQLLASLDGGRAIKLQAGGKARVVSNMAAALSSRPQYDAMLRHLPPNSFISLSSRSSCCGGCFMASASRSSSACCSCWRSLSTR